MQYDLTHRDGLLTDFVPENDSSLITRFTGVNLSHLRRDHFIDASLDLEQAGTLCATRGLKSCI
jgi:hypothetical protein